MRRVRLPNTGTTWEISDTEKTILREEYRDPITDDRFRAEYMFGATLLPSSKVYVTITRIPSRAFMSLNAPADGASSTPESLVLRETRHLDDFLITPASTGRNPQPIPTLPPDWYEVAPVAEKLTKKLLRKPIPIRKGPAMENSSDYTVGTRVEYVSNANGVPQICRGTIISRAGSKNGYPLIVRDTKGEKLVSKYRAISEKFQLPPGHLEETHPEKLSRLNPARTESWESVPKWIGVQAQTAFVQDSADIPRGATGRIIFREPEVGFAVCWDHPDSAFREIQGVPNCYIITKFEHLRLVTFRRGNDTPQKGGERSTIDNGRRFVLAAWPEFQTGCPYAPGDVLVYVGTKPTRVEGKKRVLGVSSGAVLKMLSPGDRHSVLRCLAGVPDDLMGIEVRLPTQHLSKMQHEFFEPHTEVVVSAEVEFRRKSLEGRKAVVILGTDADGDVGIQFAEDIGGGNLDGKGHDGKCLYLQAGALKISE